MPRRPPFAPALLLGVALVACDSTALVGDVPDRTFGDPTAAFTASPAGGPAPLTVTLDASASTSGDDGGLEFAWDLGDGAAATGATVEHAFGDPGCPTIALTVTNRRGGTASAAETLVVTAAAPDDEPPVATLTTAPLDHAVLPRDLETNTATAIFEGTLDSPGYEAVVLEVSRDGAVHETLSAPACPGEGGVPFAFSVAIEAELAAYDFEIFAMSGEEASSVARAEDVVAGDILLMQGQSNTVARQYDGDANVNQSDWVRSYGSRVEDGAATSAVRHWYTAEGNYAEGPGAVGQWGLRMGRLLAEQTGVPVGILNGARGGRPIGYFQRNDADPEDLSTNYGRLLSRARWAGVDVAARAVLFYQGESDGEDAAGHVAGFTALVQDWQEDFAGLEHVYTTQVRTGCGNPSLALRDGQRRLADDLEILSVMSTTGLDGHDGCHYSYANGYERLGERYHRLLARDLYDVDDGADVAAPNVAGATRSEDGTRIVVETRDVTDSLQVVGDPSAHFLLVGGDVSVTAVSAEGNTVTLTLSGDGAGVREVAYTGHTRGGDWVLNSRGTGLLTFAGIPVDAP